MDDCLTCWDEKEIYVIPAKLINDKLVLDKAELKPCPDCNNT